MLHPFLKYNQNAPRYTSYPTANHFSNQIDAVTYEKWLLELPYHTEISLYIHIPYCQSLCWYCGCNTNITTKYAPIEKYIDFLCQEILMLAHLIADKVSVSHIHFGGGSPTILNAIDFKILMQHIRENFNVLSTAEIAIEIDPRNVNQAKISTYAESGVNRASLGVQDFHSHVQEAIGRIQPIESILETANWLRGCDIHDINFDMIYGLPHQNSDIMLANIACATSFKPSRIALFGYAHVPWMKRNMRLIPTEILPKAPERFEMFQVASNYLQNHVYQAIGLDHFAHQDTYMAQSVHNKKLQRNFQGYTTDTAKILIGLGVSSISKLPQGYIQNTTFIKEYSNLLLHNQLPSTKGIVITPHDSMVADIIEQLMCYLCVDLHEISVRHAYDISLFDSIIEKLIPLCQDKLIDIQDYHIHIRPDARQIIRVICTYFDTHYRDQTRHSMAS